MSYFSLVTFIIGLASEIAGSFLAWWVLFRGIIPFNRFSEEISKQSSSDSLGGWVYRVKFENAGKRAIVDLELFAKLSVRGLRPERLRNLEILICQSALREEFPYSHLKINS